MSRCALPGNLNGRDGIAGTESPGRKGRIVQGYGATITSVSLRRGPCFGSCPVYDVTLRTDGTATWNGERFIDRLGLHQGEVGLDEYDKLTRFIARAGFFDWAPEYVTNVTDLPNYFLTVEADGQAKTVRQYGIDEPADFWVIATLVDRLAESVDWTAASPEANCHDWTAVHQQEPPSRLTVRGTCTFPTTGYSVELRRHEPQGINPSDLLLDRIVHPPTGPVADVITDVEAVYTELTDADYQTVTILPDGPSIPVEHSRHRSSEAAGVPGRQTPPGGV